LNMRFEDFTGRGAAIKSLYEAFLVGAPSHATLIVGPGGTGKRTLAGLLAQSLFCQNGDKPCGVCPACKRFVGGSHPDSHYVRGKKSIGVDEIRSLNLALQSVAYEGGYKTVIIEDAGIMTVQAQNSLLKTLEEPPPGTVFLLTVTGVGEVLPTVRSRCRIVQMPPFSAEAVEEILVRRGVERTQAARLAGLCQGSVGRALSMQEDEGYWTLRSRVLRTMENVRGPWDVWTEVNAFKDDRGDSGRVLDILEGELREALLLNLSGKEPGEDGWVQALRGADARSITGLLEKVAASRRMLASNVAWQAVLERFLLEYAKEYHQWQS